MYDIAEPQKQILGNQLRVVCGPHANNRDQVYTVELLAAPDPVLPLPFFNSRYQSGWEHAEINLCWPPRHLLKSCLAYKAGVWSVINWYVFAAKNSSGNSSIVASSSSFSSSSSLLSAKMQNELCYPAADIHIVHAHEQIGTNQSVSSNLERISQSAATMTSIWASLIAEGFCHCILLTSSLISPSSSPCFFRSSLWLDLSSAGT